MNILSNAIDAVRDIDPSSEAQHRPCIQIYTETTEHNWVRIRIIDNGSGIPEDIQNRLFDPFFTTKDPGKGTGLGLSISYQIVTDKHHGQLQCHSGPTQGTEFIIAVPIRQSTTS